MAACLYQQNRVSLKPAEPGSVESIFVPSSTSSGFGSRSYPKRRRVEAPSTLNEAEYTKQHLATDSSIYFRPDATAYPRTIHWRILDDGQLLELQSVDLYHESREPKDASLTLRFRFDNALIPQGIVIAEKVEAQSGIVLHAVTRKGEIVTLSLRDEAFMRSGFLEEGQGSAKWWKAHSPSALKVRQPYRSATWNGPKELYISLSDGGIVRLQQSDDLETWIESIFSETTWTSSVRGLFKSQATVRYGSVAIGARAACSIAPSPTGQLFWTVCLDHVVRVWSTIAGRVVHAFDLAGVDRDLKLPVTQLLDPHSRELLKVLKLDAHHDRYLLATYSPMTRAFKMWKVYEVEEGVLNVEDYHPGFTFRPPIDDHLIKTVGWQLVDYHIKTPSTNRDQHWTLWMLIRSGSNNHTFTIQFDPDLPSKKLEKQWSSQWSEVHAGFKDFASMKSEFDRIVVGEYDFNGSTGTSAFDRWISWLFKPGNFENDLLETALSIYQANASGRDKRVQSNSSTALLPLKQRVSTALNAVVATYAFDKNEAFASHEKQVLTQIKVFNGVLEDLQRHREQIIGLALDPTLDVPWLVMADELAVVRACCDLEIVNHNHADYIDQHKFTADTLLLRSLSTASTSNVGVFMHALRLLQDSLPAGLLETTWTAVCIDAIRARQDITVEDRMQAIYNQTQLEGQVSDECYHQLGNCFERLGGWLKLDNEAFDSLLNLLGASVEGRPQRRQLTTYGARSLITGAQDNLKLETEVLLNVVILVLFMGCELTEEDLCEDFSPKSVYTKAITLIRERVIISWLATTQQAPRSPDDRRIFEQENRKATKPSSGGTVLECMCLSDWASMPTPVEPTTNLLDYWARAWMYGLDVRDDYEGKIPYIMSWLLKHSSSELPGDFVKFMPSTAWSKYVCCRYYLLAGEFSEAENFFQSCADDLSANFNVSQYDAAGLLAPDEKTYFGSGLPRYHLHMVNLFETADAPSIACDVASRALQEYESGHSKDASLIRDIVARLFASSIQTSRFKDAFMALTKQSDAALRRQSLHTFLNAILATSNIDLLLDLTWPKELANEADAHLAELCTKPETAMPAPTLGLSHKPSKSSSEATPIPPHRLLYAWRIRCNDYRGAAAALWERTQMLKLAQAKGVRGKDVDAELQKTYLALINCLVIVDEKMRWLLVRPADLGSKNKRTRFASGALEPDAEVKRGTRKIVTVDDVRREYQAHLDQVADFAAGRYPLLLEEGVTDDDDMDLDVNGDGMDVMMAGGLQVGGAPQGAMEVDVFAG